MTDHLCQLARDWCGDLPPHGAMFEEKINGWRALYFRSPHDGTPRLWTRNGHRIEGVDHIIHRLGLLERAAGQPLMVDGEFQVDGSLEATKRWCESLHKFGGTAGLFHAFDIVPLVNWHCGGWEKPLYERKAWLAKLLARVEADPLLSWEWRPGSRGADEESPVRLIPDGWCFTPADVLAEVRRVWSADGEGIMLKDAEAPYQRKRSDAWLKVKRENAHKWMRKAA